MLLRVWGFDYFAQARFKAAHSTLKRGLTNTKRSIASNAAFFVRLACVNNCLNNHVIFRSCMGGTYTHVYRHLQLVNMGHSLVRAT